MHSRGAKAVCSLMGSLVIFALLVSAMRTSALPSMVMLGHFLGMGDVSQGNLLGMLAFAVAALAYFALYQLLSNHFNVIYWKVLCGIYAVCFVAIVFLKSMGIGEVNFDLSDLLLQIIEYPVSVGVNFLLFVPLGTLVAWRLRSLPKTVAVGLLIVCFIEGVQYALSLGIADVVDVVVDLAGIAFGGVAARLAQILGFQLEAVDGVHARFVIGKVPDERAMRMRAIRMAAGTAVLAALVGVCLGAGVVSYDYDPYAFLKLSKEEMSSETLVRLSELPETDTSPGKEIANVLAVFGEPVVPFVDEGNKSLFEGFVSSDISWETENGQSVTGLSLSVPVKAGSFSATCGIPLVVSNDLEVELGGSPISWEVVKRTDLLLFDRPSNVLIEPEGGWLAARRVDLLVEDSLGNAPTDAALIDFSTYDDALQRAEPLEELALAWPRLEAGDGVTMDLVLNCVTEFQGGGDYVIARFVSTVENAPIAFDVKIDCPNGVPNYDSDTMECRATIELLSDGLAVR